MPELTIDGWHGGEDIEEVDQEDWLEQQAEFFQVRAEAATKAGGKRKRGPTATRTIVKERSGAAAMMRALDNGLVQTRGVGLGLPTHLTTHSFVLLVSHSCVICVSICCCSHCCRGPFRSIVANLQSLSPNISSSKDNRSAVVLFSASVSLDNFCRAGCWIWSLGQRHRQGQV